MNITVNKDTISYLYTDMNFISEAEILLNSVIDEELAKSDDLMDTDLIDECIDALNELSSENSFPAIRLLTTKKLIKFCHKNTSANNSFFRRTAAAAIVIVFSTAMLFYTQPQLAAQAKELLNSIAYALGIAADNTIEENSKVKALYAQLADDIRLTVESEEDIDFDKINVIAVYDDNFQKDIPMEKCQTNITRGVDGDDSKLLLVVSYDGCAFSIVFTIEG
ncbi:MAG: hypothetical protein NC213_07370 [Acetobacter sp.]|nr:hypothetical protein [Bacteroides sp.]MCM1341549.1 hypothetical protein [Acetobacter sp.]MCM1433626.1 hypothetical protein [Clostridiales bacterium]